MPLISGDLKSVPLAGRLEHWICLSEINDRASPVTRVRTGVEDVHLVAIPRADLFGIFAPNEDPAIRLLVRPEFGINHEVLVRVLADQVAPFALVSNDRAVLNPPVGFANFVESLE